MTLSQRLFCSYLQEYFSCLFTIMFLFIFFESIDHRQHGNRIIREFILGSKNIHRFDKQKKSHEYKRKKLFVDFLFFFSFSRDLVKDGMLLYRHSARCSVAMQWFLDCNPHYWPFVPITKEQARIDNESYVLPSSIPTDPTSTNITAPYIRSDLEAGTCLTDLPPFSSNDYTFSTRQCAEQFQIFKNERNLLLPNNDLDLYNATIIAVCKY